MFLCKTLLFMTLGSQRNMYKNILGEMSNNLGEMSIWLFALKLNYLSSKAKIKISDY